VARRTPQGRPNPQAATYWRRRFVALLIGLAVLALIAWAFSGTIGGGGGDTGSGGTPQGQGGVGVTGAGLAGTGHGGTSGSAGAQGSAAQAGLGGTPTRRAVMAAAGKPRPCPVGVVVLSLVSSQVSYGIGQLPQFSVNIVATAQQTCTFNVGARHVALVIHSGSVRVWSSADCAQGAGSLVSDLQRGVPTSLVISWNRRASSPSCSLPPARMPAGTYSATAIDGALRSNAVTFRIS
jgi:hypothetical protein